MLTLGQQQVHFEFTQSNYLLVTFVRMVLSIVKGEFWYQMVLVSRFSQSVQTLSSQRKASYTVALVYLCIHLNFPSDCASGFGQMRMRYSL